jgi:hypothetical protein
MKLEEIAAIRIKIKDPFPDPDPNQRGSGSAALSMTLPFLALLTANAVFCSCFYFVCTMKVNIYSRHGHE